MFMTAIVARKKRSGFRELATENKKFLSHLISCTLKPPFFNKINPVRPEISSILRTVAAAVQGRLPVSGCATIPRYKNTNRWKTGLATAANSLPRRRSNAFVY